MRIKTKVTLGVAFLFGVILIIGGVGLFYLNQLSGDAKNILTDNYESIEYMKNILEACERMPGDSAEVIGTIEQNVSAQERNITEIGEQESTIALRNAFEKFKSNTSDIQNLALLRHHVLAIQEINMKAMVRKNEITQETAGKASSYVIAIGTVFSLIAFTFIVNFPGYIGNPIAALTGSIKAIANKNYEERLHFDRKDEFEELAVAFNSMAEKLDEYEHSNLANILFQKKRIETIINRMHDPVIGFDQKKRIIFVNTEALELLNMKEDELVGQYAPDVAVNNDLLRDLIKDLSSGASPSEKEMLKIFAHGKESYFSREIIMMAYTPTGEKKTVPIGVVIILKNITSFKEQDLAKTNFIATISHELKTPIASLQMCTKLLGDPRVGPLNEEQQHVVQTLGDETNRLTKITHELLDLAQVETGNIKLKVETLDPQEIVEVALEATKFHAERKKVKINWRPLSNLPRIQADADKTSWVLVNLLTNAIRYSPENGEVTVKCSKENSKVVFSVEDSGTGIEEKYLNRIFERFFQIPGSTTGGTGLGLAISKEFIEAQGGEMTVKSEIGKGSKFSFSLQEYKEQSVLQ